eukprot:TRINITY_DN768_c0_g2_i1.p1 TRINITY_DN768_c0_g2~~TRINITY_DN768_c0_g2_i1.p1  ORF type:complete len:219 (-),score=29.80 TRINITY_DN768_c0_g2_i1:193-849(-)
MIPQKDPIDDDFELENSGKLSLSDSEHKCCMGFLYYSEAMQRSRKNPICIGLAQTHPQIEDMSEEQQDSSHLLGFKYVCLGYSIYECEQKRRKLQNSLADIKEVGNDNLPYCEGLEMISTMQGAPQRTPVTMKEGLDGGGSDTEIVSVPKKRIESFTSPWSNNGLSNSDIDWSDVPQKIYHKASRIVEKMGSNLFQMTNTSFQGLLKFLDEINGRGKA